MSDGKITFANIVATPTPTAWSQAYTAGKLYAVLSLEGKDTESSHLAATGKEIINALVEEFFTLETKDLTTIKTAVIQTSEKVPQEIQACLVVVSVVSTVVYAFSFGGGKVMLKRNDKVGTILQPKGDDEKTVQAVSGFLQSDDTIILQTKQFADTVTTDDIKNFATPTEAVELLSPKIHGKELGGASAIILNYKEEAAVVPLAQETFPEEKEEEEIPSALEAEVAEKVHVEKARFTLPKIRMALPHIKLRIPFKMLLLLLIPLVLLGILGFSIWTTKQRQENEKIQKLFEKVYPTAEKQYNEGQALLSLNKTLAQDDFQKAETLLAENINKFPKDSSEYQKIQELYTKVQSVTEEQAGGKMIPATEVSASNSPLLQALLKNKATYTTQSDTTIYTGSTTGIQTADGKTIIENGDDWKALGGIGAFGANVYVLDKTGNEILKYLGASKDSKSTYASGAFTKAAGMAIDSSIYVLNNDGSVKKFTRGSLNAFGITGLETPLKSPIRIFTNADTDNVYILDPGTSRVVVLNKSGDFQQAYTATIISNAQDFDVQEKNKKIYILSSEKVYEISIP